METTVTRQTEGKAEERLKMQSVVSLWSLIFADGVCDFCLAVAQMVSKFLTMQEDEPLIHF